MPVVSSGSAWSWPSTCRTPWTTSSASSSSTEPSWCSERCSGALRAATVGADHHVAEQQRRHGASARCEGRRAGGAVVRVTGRARRGRPSMREREDVGGPGLVHEPLVEVGDGGLVDEQHRQLGVAGDALGAKHVLGQALPPWHVDGEVGLLVGRRRPRGRPPPGARRRRPETGTARRGRAVEAVVVAGSSTTGTSPGSEPCTGAGSLVGVDDVLHDAVAHDVARSVRRTKRQPVDAGEDLLEAEEPGAPAAGTSTWVTSPVTTAWEPKPMRVRNIFICSGGGVLGLVEDDEAVVERAAAHEGERGDLDRAPLEQLLRGRRARPCRRGRRRAAAGTGRPWPSGRRAGTRGARRPRRPGG